MCQKGVDSNVAIAMNLQPHDRCAKAMYGMNANNIHGITSDTYNAMISVVK